MKKIKEYKNSETENTFSLNCRKLGLQTTKRGWPDFLVFKVKGRKIHFCFVEVKRDKQIPSTPQRKIIAILRKMGLPIFISENGEIPKLENFKSLKYREMKTEMDMMKNKYK